VTDIARPPGIQHHSGIAFIRHYCLKKKKEKKRKKKMTAESNKTVDNKLVKKNQSKIKRT
jgi:hypothetical protein